MNFTDFKQTCKDYLSAKEKASFLRDLKEKNNSIAETLLLFRKILHAHPEEEETFKTLYAHFIINTTGEIPGKDEEEPLPVREWVQFYAHSLGIKMTLKKEKLKSFFSWAKRTSITKMYLTRGEGVPADFPWPGDSDDLGTLEQLREAGREVNFYRYGGYFNIPFHAFDFQDAAGKHSLENAIWLSHFSELAYHHRSFVKSQLTDWGFDPDSFEWIEDKRFDTQGFMISDDKRLIVAFRGTESLQDGLVDLKFRKTDAEDFDGTVHRGFNEAFQNVKTQLSQSISKKVGNRTVYLTGHSLGAALSQLAAYVIHTIPEVSFGGVYLYGSPRVGDPDFSKAYNERISNPTFLHINHQDIVARIPPEWLGYKQVGIKPQRFFFNNDFELTPLSELEPAEDGKTSAEESSTRSTRGFLEIVEDKENYDPKAVISALAMKRDHLHKTSFSDMPVTRSKSEPIDRGPIDDHSINHYSYKFGKALLESYWKAEGSS
jgi:triacylglycerol lipase